MPANSRRGLQRFRRNGNAAARPQQTSGMHEYSSLLNDFPAYFLFLAERTANAVNSKCSADCTKYIFPVLSTSMRSIFSMLIKFCDCYLRTNVGVLYRTTYVHVVCTC